MKNNIELLRKRARISIDEISNKLGMTFQNFRNIELGKTELKKKYEDELCDILKCSVEDLYNTNIDMNNIGNIQNKKLIPIKFFDLSASAGFGCFVDNEKYTMIEVGEEFLNKIGIINNYNNIAILKATGNSMFPTIHNNDLLFVDITKKEIFNNKIYIINEDNLLKVKRILKSSPFDKEVVIQSDNQQDGDYPPYNLKIDGNENLICGTVIFFCRSL